MERSSPRIAIWNVNDVLRPAAGTEVHGVSRKMACAVAALAWPAQESLPSPMEELAEEGAMERQ